MQQCVLAQVSDVVSVLIIMRLCGKGRENKVPQPAKQMMRHASLTYQGQQKTPELVEHTFGTCVCVCVCVCVGGGGIAIT